MVTHPYLGQASYAMYLTSKAYCVGDLSASLAIKIDSSDQPMDKKHFTLPGQVWYQFTHPGRVETFG